MEHKPPIQKAGRKREAAGIVRDGEVYTVPQFLQLVGWRRGALRRAERDGLATRKAGGKLFIVASDFIAFLQGRPPEEIRRQERREGGEGAK